MTQVDQQASTMRSYSVLLGIILLAAYPPMESSSSEAFIFETKPTIRPDLHKIVDAQPDTRIVVSLDVGQSNDKTASRMAVKGMVLHLAQRPPAEGHVKMPGTHGPHPELSAGLRQLDFVEDGQFVSLSGVKHVTGKKGSWEVVWKNDAPAGSLICGFELPESYARNDAHLPGKNQVSKLTMCEEIGQCNVILSFCFLEHSLANLKRGVSILVSQSGRKKHCYTCKGRSTGS